MKSYIVKKQFAGLKEGQKMIDDYLGKFQYPNDGELVSIHPHDISFALALGFIEETGKIAQEVGGEENNIFCAHCKKPLDTKLGNETLTFLHKDCHKTTSQPPQNEWRPKIGESYFFVQTNGAVNEVLNDECEIDTSRFPIGNFFRTESAALRAAEEIRNLLKKLPKE